MRSNERGEEHDTAMYLIKLQCLPMLVVSLNLAQFTRECVYVYSTYSSTHRGLAWLCFSQSA